MKYNIKKMLPSYYFLFLLVLLSQSISAQDSVATPNIMTYTGSSTIGNFLEKATLAFGKIDFKMDTRPESTGGELAILEGRTDLAGIARPPSKEALGKGVVSSLIGWDAIAIIVHPDNPVQNLTQSQLKAVFTGTIRNWKELGGPDLAINPYIVGIESATRKVCRSVILGKDDYVDCEVVKPDVGILNKVANDPRSIGHISFSFVDPKANVKTVSVNGQPLSLTNSNYPITRPLYFLWWPGRRDVAEFVEWTLSSEGQRIVMQQFIGAREGTIEVTNKSGTLVVYTETFTVEDGGIFYYPHQSYEVLSTDRKLVMSVANHLSDNDESPTRIELTPGNYLIRTKQRSGQVSEFFVSIESGKRTKVNPTDVNLEKESSAQKAGADKQNIYVSDFSKNREQLFTPYGDFRIRTEQDMRTSSERFRGRLRIRAGMSAQVSSSSKFNLRLVSTSNSDDPNSSHVNLNNGFNQIRVAIDRAYFRVQLKQLPSFQWWLGKFSNPVFSSNIFSEIVWDSDDT